MQVAVVSLTYVGYTCVLLMNYSDPLRRVACFSIDFSLFARAEEYCFTRRQRPSVLYVE